MERDVGPVRARIRNGPRALWSAVQDALVDSDELHKFTDGVVGRRLGHEGHLAAMNFEEIRAHPEMSLV
jgi:hypothetical protein